MVLEVQNMIYTLFNSAMLVHIHFGDSIAETIHHWLRYPNDAFYLD